MAHAERLDVGVDLDVRTEFGPDRRLQAVRLPMRRFQAHAAVYLKIEADAEPAAEVLHHDVVDEHAPARGDQHDALQDRLVIERSRLRRYRDLGTGKLPFERAADLALDGDNVLQGQSARDAHEEFAEHLSSGRADAHALD